jgi:hypothetical protein
MDRPKLSKKDLDLYLKYLGSGNTRIYQYEASANNDPIAKHNLELIDRMAVNGMCRYYEDVRLINTMKNEIRRPSGKPRAC